MKERRVKSAEVKTEVVFAMDLIGQLRDGRLRVPKFQRPFVWNHEKVRRLLDSILRGYPIGSVFVWETVNRYDNLDHVGPVAVEIDHPHEPTPVGYLLDGHQRLSTLMGTLAATDDELNRSKSTQFRVYFNLESEDFEHSRAERSHLFPIWRLMDTSTFLDECERLRREAPSLETAARWIATARRLVDTFQKCAIGVTRVFHKEMKEAIEAFTRLNTEGQKMTPDQVFFALAYREGKYNLAAQLDRIIEDVLAPRQYHDISRTALLRVVLAALERDIYSRAVDWRDLVEKEHDRLPAVIESCRQSLDQTLRFLHDRIGASSQKTLPYALQLVFLNEFFRVSPDEPEQHALDTLERWFWVSSFSGAFMVGSSARFNEVIAEARSLARGDSATGVLDLDAPALPQPPSFHPRAARVRAFFLFMKHLKPLSPRDSKPVLGVLDHGIRDALLIFRDVDVDQEIRRNLANRVLVGKDFQGEPLLWFNLLSTHSEESRRPVLDSHGISEEAWDALQQNDVNRFIEERRKRLRKAEIEFMKEKGVVPPRIGEEDLVDLPDDAES